MPSSSLSKKNKSSGKSPASASAAAAASAAASAEAGPASSQECSVCCEPYNNSTRARIVCDYTDCQYNACRGCVQQYLLSTAENPHCMACKNAWNQRTVELKLQKSFMANTYMKHRRNLLLERELSKLPEAMEAANTYQQCKEHEDAIELLTREIRKLDHDRAQLLNKIATHKHTITDIKRGGTPKDGSEKRKFIMPCSSADCRGYLSTQYKCDICKLYTCKDCFETIGYTKEDEHECDENNVKSATSIKEQTRPCPTCGVRIYKITGCDQMWCTECRTAFSWETGVKDTGNIHNPHFHQYQRSINNGNAPRTPGDVVCGGVPSYFDINYAMDQQKTETGVASPFKSTIMEIHRFVNDITHTRLRNIRIRVLTYEDTLQQRIWYILKKISKEELSVQIYRNDKARKKCMEMIHIYEILSVVGIELLQEICTIEAHKYKTKSFNTLVETKIQEYTILRDYCNEQFKIISLSYSQNVPIILENWFMKETKFTKAGEAVPKVDKNKKV
jgi:hypothetical protein